MLPVSDQTDTDSDGVGDVCDNCIAVANGTLLPAGKSAISQRDTDGDGYGNICDADLDNSGGTVNLTDYSRFRSAFGKPAPGSEPYTLNDHADFNGDGQVNLSDYSIFRASFGKAPGPTGLNPALDNTRPRAAAGPDQSVTVAQTVHLDGSNSSDLDGEPLTYWWTVTSVPAASAAVLSSSLAVQPTFVADQAGLYQFALVAFDGTALSSADTVVISTGNSPPVAAAGPDQPAQLGETVILDGSSSTDVDGDLLNYNWSIITLPPGSAAVLSDQTAIQPGFAVDQAGDYIASLVLNDGFLDSAADTVTITTGNVQPVANAGPDQSVNFSDLVQLDGTGSIDANNDPLSYMWSLVSVPAGSSASLDNPNLAQPVFSVDLAGTYVGQLIVNDALIDSEPDNVVITTDNSRPVADAGSDETVTSTTLFTLDGSGSNDADGDLLTYQWALISRPVTSAAALINPTAVNPELTPDVPGNYVVQLIVNDGILSSNPDTSGVATVTITATANDLPVAIPDAFTMDEDDTLSSNVLTDNGSGPDSLGDEPTTVEQGTITVSNGTLTLNPDGSFSYTPYPNFSGQDTFTYTLTDITPDTSNEATVTITVTPVNDLPVAVPDAFTMDEDSTLNANVLPDNGNGPDSLGDEPTAVSLGATSVSNGTLHLNTDGSFSYTPNPNFNGPDSFSYTLTDSSPETSPEATVTITVTPVNDLPVAVPDAFTMDEDSTLNANVLADNGNGPDSLGDEPTAVSLGATSVSNGTLLLNTDGSFSYTPNPNFNGQDTFTYALTDSTPEVSPQATVTITVTPVNDLPVAVPDAFTMDEDGMLNASVLADNGNGPDSLGDEPTTVSPGTVTVSNGTLFLNTDGSFSYLPDPNFNGQDSFTYILTDSTPETSPEATVTITVTPVNDRPLVDAGPDKTVTLPNATETLNGTASDDGEPGGTLITGWSHVGGTGTGTVVFTDPSAVDTSVTISQDPGTYVLRLNADDGELSAFDEMTVTVDPGVVGLDYQVSSSSDDAEEQSDGKVGITSSDLELVEEASNQTVGIRFTGMDIPPGAPILDASIQFTVDEATTDPTSLTIAGEAADNAPTFSASVAFGISARPRTTATVNWDPASWPTVGEAGPDQRTPNLAAVIQEIVNRAGWSAGNSLAVIITGDGRRIAEAFDGTAAPRLHIEYAGSPVNHAPTVDAGPGAFVILPQDTAVLDGTVNDDGLPSGTLMTTWSRVGGTGTGTVTFGDAAAIDTTVTFAPAVPGTYVLRLTANDGELSAFDDATVTLSEGGDVVAINQVNQFSTGFNTSTNTPLTIPSIDPAGLVYHEPSGRLFIADSEINEVAPAFAVVQADLFEVDPAGNSLFHQWDLTRTTGNEPSPNEEPTGIAYCADDAHFYVSNDDADLIYRYEYNGDGSPFTAVGAVSTRPGSDDPEGITCDPASGRLYVIGGVNINISVYEYNGGFALQEVLDLVTTAGNPSGIPSDAEGITYDPVSGHLFVVSDPDAAIFEYTTSGIFIQKFDIDGLSPRPIAPQGISIGTSSVNPQNMSFYLADGMVDNDSDPNERDGRIYELEIQRAQ